MFGAGAGVGTARARPDGGIVDELDRDVTAAIVPSTGALVKEAVVGIPVRSAG